jgi:UDP-N-acetylglucosamine transferase subunit ALG13
MTQSELARYILAASVVVTHGGPATIAEAIAAGHVPLVVPRLRRLGEQVDDHQLAYARRLDALGEIELVLDAAALPEVVKVLRPIRTRPSRRASVAVALRFRDLVKDL